MKVKRWISLLLTFALCLGLVSVAVGAETEGSGGTNDLPGGHAQMYHGYGDDVATSISQPAGFGTDVLLYSGADESSVLNDANSVYTISCDTEVGVVGTGRNGIGTNWVTSSAVPGASGYIYAVNGDYKYAIRVSVGDPLTGVYTQTPDKSDLSKGYVVRTGRSYQVSYDPSAESNVVYICTGLTERAEDWMFSNPTSSNSAVSVALSEDSQTLTVTLDAEQTGTVETTISVYVNDEMEADTYNLEFIDCTALYNDRGDPVTLRNEVGGRRTFHLYYGESLEVVPTSATVTLSGDNLGSIRAATGEELQYGNWVWTADTALINASGKLNANVEGKIYSCSVTVGAPLFGLYSKIPSDGDYSGYIAKENGASTVNFTSNGSKIVYLYIDNDDFSFNTTGFESDNEAVTVDRIDNKTLRVTLAEGSTGTINTLITCPATDGNNNEQDWDYRIIFTDGTGNSSGDNQGGSGDTLIEGAHDLETDEIYPSERINEHMGEFTLPGDSNTYYMVPSSPQSSSGTDYPHLNGDSSSYDAQTRLMFIEFWVGQGQNNYARVKDTATLAKIQEAFGDTLKMELLAAEYYQSPMPTGYPATYTTTEVDAWRQPIKATFDADSAGTWVYCASGTINGKTITAEVRSTLWFRTDVVWSPNTSSDIDAITQVNNYLKGTDAHNVPGTSGIIIALPAGTYYGYINVPSDLDANGVTICGAGTDSTVLHGGVQGENRRTHVESIHFIGGGFGNGDKTWKGFSDERSVNNGKDNYAFYGYCGGNFRNCIFENYYCAVLTTGETKTGTGNVFENNQTAVCYDSVEWGGIGDSLASNVYQSNEIAIHFARFTDHIGLSILSITESCFVDNKTDIRNDIKRNIYVPGNYFAYTNNSVEEARECQYLPQANGNKEKLVHYYPQSANRQFSDWIFDMDFYKHDPVVSANLAATYAIPVEYLTNTTITVMNEDEALAVWTFGEENK